MSLREKFYEYEMQNGNPLGLKDYVARWTFAVAEGNDKATQIHAKGTWNGTEEQHAMVEGFFKTIAAGIVDCIAEN